MAVSRAEGVIVMAAGGEAKSMADPPELLKKGDHVVVFLKWIPAQAEFVLNFGNNAVLFIGNTGVVQTHGQAPVVVAFNGTSRDDALQRIREAVR